MVRWKLIYYIAHRLEIIGIKIQNIGISKIHDKENKWVSFIWIKGLGIKTQMNLNELQNNIPQTVICTLDNGLIKAI